MPNIKRAGGNAVVTWRENTLVILDPPSIAPPLAVEIRYAIV